MMVMMMIVMMMTEMILMILGMIPDLLRQHFVHDFAIGPGRMDGPTDGQTLLYTTHLKI